jgi:hypothetical protein
VGGGGRNGRWCWASSARRVFLSIVARRYAVREGVTRPGAHRPPRLGRMRAPLGPTDDIRRDAWDGARERASRDARLPVGTIAAMSRSSRLAGARADRVALAALLLLSVALPVVVGLASGAIAVPHNDDFNYRRVALTLYGSGRVELTGWTVMSLIGQLALVQPFLWASGGEPWAFAAFTAALAVVGVTTSYLLARRVLPATRAFLAVLLVVVFPGFLLNTTSFMTDVPAYAGTVLCLGLGVAALSRVGRPRWALLAASLAVGCVAFSIREFALAAPVAVLVSSAASAPGRRWRYAAAGLAVAIACAAIHFVTAGLPGQGSATLAPLSPTNVERTLRAATTLAFGLSPAILVAAAWWVPRIRVPESIAGAAGAALLFGGSFVAIVTGPGIPSQLVGNLLLPEGAPGSGALAGDRPILFASPWWEAMGLLALGAAVLGAALLAGVAGLAVRRRAFPDVGAFARGLGTAPGLLVAFAMFTAAGLVAFGLVASMFDRYLWPLALPLAILLLHRPAWAAAPDDAVRASRQVVDRLGIAAGALALAVVSAAACALLLNSAAFDAARWRMGEAAVSAGYDPATVDAGMEWVGYHATGTAVVGAAGTATVMWYGAWWPSFRQCAVISSSLLDVPGLGLTQADVEAYRLLLVAGPEEPLYLYSVAAPGCPGD